MTFLTKSQVLKLFDGFKIEHLKETHEASKSDTAQGICCLVSASVLIIMLMKRRPNKKAVCSEGQMGVFYEASKKEFHDDL